jgi:hypothetical protein
MIASAPRRSYKRDLLGMPVPAVGAPQLFCWRVLRPFQFDFDSKV